MLNHSYSITGSARKRRRLRSRKAMYPKMESELCQYVRDLRGKGHAVHVPMIQHKAKELMKELYPEVSNFKASTGWVEKFKKRNDLTQRRFTRYFFF